MGGGELACSQVTTMRRLLHETLVMVGRNVLQPAQVSKKELLRRPFPVLLLWLMLPYLLSFFFMQRLARDMAEVVKPQEEANRVQAAAVMVRAHAAQAEGMAREKATLLAKTHDEAAGATQRVSIL
jgi:hypothetical protein